MMQGIDGFAETAQPKPLARASLDDTLPEDVRV